MNRERLLKLADTIEGADRFNLAYFGIAEHTDEDGRVTSVQYENQVTASELAEKCYTAGCVCGWAIAAFAPHNKLADAALAAEILDLTSGEADELFTPSSQMTSVWMHVIEPQHVYEASAQQAASLLRMIANGEVEFEGSDSVGTGVDL